MLSVNRMGHGIALKMKPLRLLSQILFCLVLWAQVFSVWAITASAVEDLTCAGTRFGADLNCTAGEYTLNPVFSAEPGTNPFCLIGQTFRLKVEIDLSGSNTDRQDIGFFVGQSANDPGINDPAALCSVATFPTTPAPWEDNDGDVCGDYDGNGASITLIDQIKVDCLPGTGGSLQIPYLLSYWQNNGNVCTGALDVVPGSKSKCNKGSATVSGTVTINAGAWLDVTKQTSPNGDSQIFSYTATGPVGSTVIALVGATLTDSTSSGGTYIPATIALATNMVNFTLQDGETARVLINALPAATQTLSITEAQATGWDPIAAITCQATNATATATTTDDANRTMTADLDQTDYSAKCTITNVKRPAVTLTKISNGDIATFNFTGNNSWASQNITTATPGLGVAGVIQYLPYDNATTITETVLAGFRLTGIVCSVSAGTATYDIPNRRVILNDAAMAPGMVTTCTYSNIRERNLTVVKGLVPNTDTGLFVMNANGTTTAEAGDGATASAVVDVAATVSFAETAGTGTNLVDYTTSYSCDTAPLTTGNTTSSNLTMPNADVTCTFTNTRKSATLVLRKMWANAINGDTATVNSASFVNNATSGASVSTGNNTTTGTSVTVYSAEAGTISETVSVGDSNNYNASLACTGSGGLSGNTLTVAPADTAIVCTYTNDRKSANFTLRKDWVNAYANGDTATVSSASFVNNATSGASVTTGNNTTTGTNVTVYAAEVGTISESFSVGNLANYQTLLFCSGTSGLAGNTLTVAPADTDIICTYRNTGLKALLSVLKMPSVVSDPINNTINPKAIPAAIIAYTIRVTNIGLGTADNNSIVITDFLPAEVVMFVGDLGTGTGPFTFTEGAPASGISLSYVSLGSLVDSLEFSNDNGVTWTYVPTPDGNGLDATVTDIRLRPVGAMNASAGGGDPYFEVTFHIQLQ